MLKPSTACQISFEDCMGNKSLGGGVGIPPLQGSTSIELNANHVQALSILFCNQWNEFQTLKKMKQTIIL